jgi:AmmeMemoRadiSam system protein B
MLAAGTPLKVIPFYISEDILNKELEEFFANASKELNVAPDKVKAIIGPHAGFRYSGPVAAFSYKYLEQHPSEDLRIFLIGPSHHKYFNGCSVSNLDEL